MNPLRLTEYLAQAMDEDMGNGDITTYVTVPDDMTGSGYIEAKEAGIVAGLEVITPALELLDAEIEVEIHVDNGDQVAPGDKLASFDGSVPAILKAERTIINLLQYLSGIATETGKYVDAVHETGVWIVSTRKILPGLRGLAKMAVMAGGGHFHRFSLESGILIKNNHIFAAGSITAAMEQARMRCPFPLKLEVEVQTADEAREAVMCGADIVMLDNMDLDTMTSVVEEHKGQALFEASGGVTLETVGDIAKTGVDFISVGALTHHVKSLDIHLVLDKKDK